jgi:iron complex outermembrane receptor protein
MQAKGQRAPVQAFDSTYLFGLLATTALVGVALVSPARAADSAAPTVQLAQAAPAQATVAQRRVAFSIPAQSLGAALSQFGRQSGLQVTAPGAMTGGLQSPGVSGEMTPNEALTRLLSGTGLSWRQPDAQTVILVEAPKGSGATTLPTISVQGARPLPPQAEIGNLPPEYAGGQVARGGKLGVLGNRDMMDTPFTQMSYTSKLVQGQQAQHIGDVIKNDPAVTVAGSSAAGGDFFKIRGIDVSNQDFLFNGMPNVTPSYFNSVMSEGLERIEVLRGPSAMMNGTGSGNSVGGTINLMPKRAGDTPLTQFNGSFLSDAQLGGHVDFGRRFGKDNALGLRLNGVYRDGDTPIDHQSRESRLLTAGLDYRGETLRLETDLGYQYQRLEGLRQGVTFNAGVPVLKTPNTRSNFAAPWEFLEPEVFFGVVKGEFDVTSNITTFASFGAHRREALSLRANRNVTNAAGDLSATTTQLGQDLMTGRSAEAGVRANFQTGPVGHQAVVAYSYQDRLFRDSRTANSAVPASNLYNHTFAAEPSYATTPDARKAPPREWLVLDGITVGNTLSVLNDSVQVPVGVRFQHIDIETFNRTTGARTGGYDERAASPYVGLVVKPWDGVSLYTSYVEGLQKGEQAGVGTVNEGQIFDPYVSKQYEVGAKWDLGNLTATVAAYQITQPNSYTLNNVFSVDGEQRNRGVDLNIFGEVMEGVRLLGGVSFLDAEQVKTSGGTNDGKQGTGAPKYRFVMGGEWDTPFLRGFSLTGRAVHNMSAYLDAANTQKVDDWTRYDVGAKYTIDRGASLPIVVYFSVENVFDSNYWTTTGGQAYISDPRTYKVTTSFNF